MLGDLLDEVHGHTLVLVALNEAEEIFSEDFEDHADMGAVGSLMTEVIEEGDDVGTTGMSLGRGRRGVGVGWGWEHLRS